MRRCVLLSALLGLGYATFAVLRHWHFKSSGYDLGIFDQAVWHYSRFEQPTNTFSGHTHILAEHFHPILMLLAPLYWPFPRAETLLVVQSMLLAASIIPVFVAARRRVGERNGLLLAAAYGLFWGIQAAAAFDFHEFAFAPLLVATAILGLETRRSVLLWPAALLLLAVREDLAPLVVAFGLWLVAQRERGQGLLLAGIGVGAFALIIRVVMPAFSDHGVYQFSGAYSAFGDDPLSIAGGILRHPGRFVSTLVSPPVKLRTLFYWLAPFLFLPLVSPLVLLSVPLVLERFLSSSENHWVPAFHYTAPMAPILALAAAQGLARVPERWRSLTAGGMLVLCAVLPGKLPLWRLTSPGYYRLSETERIGYRALATIPPEASVVAQDAIASHLSQRDRIFTLRPGAPEAEYVIASRGVSEWPNGSFEEIEALLDVRRAEGYEAVFDEGDWLVLKRRAAIR